MLSYIKVKSDSDWYTIKILSKANLLYQANEKAHYRIDRHFVQRRGEGEDFLVMLCGRPCTWELKQQYIEFHQETHNEVESNLIICLESSDSDLLMQIGKGHHGSLKVSSGDNNIGPFGYGPITDDPKKLPLTEIRSEEDII
jgi:hypothetical protein